MHPSPYNSRCHRLPFSKPSVGREWEEGGKRSRASAQNAISYSKTTCVSISPQQQAHIASTSPPATHQTFHFFPHFPQSWGGNAILSLVLFINYPYIPIPVPCVTLIWSFQDTCKCSLTSSGSIHSLFSAKNSIAATLMSLLCLLIGIFVLGAPQPASGNECKQG